MGCCNEPVVALAAAAVDPTQHVNYAKGMVLGVDDFTQEFAYLSGRDQWLARDAIGYGTLSGLHVFAEDAGEEGPRLHVTAGSALVPSGKHVCVPADQCATINRWLAKPENAAIVHQLLNPSSPPVFSPASPPLSPPDVTSGPVSLYLTLCYSDCPTRPVPIPGEPCRSDDALMANSRIADDFRLELRPRPPAQVEEDALRDFVRWLRANVDIVDSSSPAIGDDEAWLAAMRPAVQAWLDAEAMSPPSSPPPSFATLGDYLVDLSPNGITITQGQLCEFLRVAFRFWVTELRPMWMARRCHRPMVADTECILLARVTFDVAWVGGSPTGVYQIVGSPGGMQIDETLRPFVVHLRMLQEWLFCGCDCTGHEVAPAVGGGSIPLAPTMPAMTGTAGRFPVLRTSDPVTLDDSHYCVICAGSPSLELRLPASLPMNAGRVFVVKNIDVGTLTISPDSVAGDQIDDKTSYVVKKKRAVTIIADGNGRWQIIGTGE